MNADLIKQVSKWHDAEEHQAIINALEQLPEAERDAEAISLLARAYNNQSDYVKAEALLESIRQEGEDDALWNFRMGYALFYQDREREALPYFTKAAALDPEDPDAPTFIRWCNLYQPLAKRVEEFWNWFVGNEEKLSGMMQPKSSEDADAFMAFISEGTRLISERVQFNIGGDHEFTFSVEGWPDLFIIYPYVLSRMPECLKGKWKFFPFNQGTDASFGFKMFDTDFELGNIQVLPSYLEESGDFHIKYYDPGFVKLSDEQAEGAFRVMLDLMLGEGVAVKYIRTVEKSEKCEKGMMALSQLRTHIEKALQTHGKEFFENPKDVYTAYHLTPEDSKELRADVMVGTTCMESLVAEYYSQSTELFDHANSFGAQAIFLVFRNSQDGQPILNFRHDLEDRIADEILKPNNLGQVIGGATGSDYSYIDLFVFDIFAFLQKVRPLLEEYADYSFYAADFIRNGDLRKLTEADSEMVPYTPDDAEEFFTAIDQWNERDCFSKCIRILERIPEADRNYEVIMRLVRSYENYAILGDHGQEPETEKQEKALTKALELLESVREAGENQAAWNMRMAYAYQYLPGQKEQAVAYARKWAELDPEDEAARQVIEECSCSAQESIDDSEEQKPGTFVGFALLADENWNREKFIHDLKEQWDIEACEEEGESQPDDALVFNVGEMMAAVSLMSYPVPHGEAAESAKNNYMWPEAEQVAQAHRAHLMVAVLGNKENLIERGKLYVKLLSVCCLQENVTGIYTSGVVFQPRLYEGFAGMMKEGSLPIFNWIWFGLYRTEKGVSGYTYGMECFGKDEMEVLDVDAEPSEVRDFLASMVGYVLEYDVVLNDGETIGFSADDKHSITRNNGVALPDKMTLKISYGNVNEAAEASETSDDDTDQVMDNVECDVQKIEEKELAVDPMTAYNHVAIYLRWCIENGLMSEDFLEQYGEVVRSVKDDAATVDLRLFIKEKLHGSLNRRLFNKEGRAFADYYYGWYYGANEHPFFPGDIDNYALEYFGPERYHSDEFKEEAYLFIPFDNEYYQQMAQLMDRRFANWHGQRIDSTTAKPSELAVAFMDYLDCECTYFPSMSDDDPIMSAYTYAKRLGVREGYVPVLIKVDEVLWECLILNSDPSSENAEAYNFNWEEVEAYRKEMLETPVREGKSVLDDLVDKDLQGQNEALEGGYNNHRFASYWDTETDMTYPLILARIPVREPWKIFAYLPFGDWNDCPATPELMAVSKYWYETYGAVPCVMTHDELEFELPAPIPETSASQVALEQYAFCPDMDQNFEHVGSLADTLRQSKIWYFWWD